MIIGIVKCVAFFTIGNTLEKDHDTTRESILNLSDIRAGRTGRLIALNYISFEVLISVQMMKRHFSIIQYQSRVYASSRPACRPYDLSSMVSAPSLSLGASFQPYL